MTSSLPGKVGRILGLAALLQSGPNVARALETNGVAFWWPGGTYTNFVGVELVASNMHVKFTLDGSTPDESSPTYSSPILVTRDRVIKARPFRRNEPPGAVAEQRYRIIQSSIAEFSSPLPMVILGTLGLPIEGRSRVPTWISIFDSNHGHSSVFARLSYNGNCSAGLRGSSSIARPKKPYRIELQDAQGEDRAVPLFGMPPEADWILYPAYTDTTMIRDVLAYELWRKMGHYAPRHRFVELFVVRSNRNFCAVQDGRLVPLDSTSSRDEPARTLIPEVSMGDYEGVYVLLEKIKRDKGRLNLSKLYSQHTREPEITGGYIFKKDRLNPQESGFRSASGIPFAFEEPKEAEITPQQSQWLTNYVNAAERALISEEFRDARTGYRQFFDTASFIDYQWISEVSCNFDSYGYSIFLHKDLEGKLAMGPIWDWDLSFGNSASHTYQHMGQWRWEVIKDPFYQWYERMFKDPDFLQEYIDRWSQLRQGALATPGILSLIDALTSQIEPVATRNFQRWPRLNPHSHMVGILGTNYTGHVDWLKGWVTQRLAWIDSEGFPAPTATLVQDKGFLTQCVQLTGQGGAIYFTTDSTDPRLSGGQVSSRAQVYQEPVPLESRHPLIARVQSPYGLWSPPLVVDARSSAPPPIRLKGK